MTKVIKFFLAFSILAMFIVSCDGDSTAGGSASAPENVSFPTTPPDCGNDCPPAFPSA